MADFKTVDISETALHDFDPEVMDKLLLDHTTHKNILWCTDNYAHLGEGYAETDEITVEKIHCRSCGDDDIRTVADDRILLTRRERAAGKDTCGFYNAHRVYSRRNICGRRQLR